MISQIKLAFLLVIISILIIVGVIFFSKKPGNKIELWVQPKSEYNNQAYSRFSTDSGKYLFENYCTACHRWGNDLIGPPLDSIRKRRADLWVINFLRHPEQFKKDTYFRKLQKKYSGITHPAYNLSSQQIKMILDYFDHGWQSVPVP